MDCIFCLIVAGGLPAEKVYEDEAVVAFLDIAPVNHGHTLVIPKAHFEDITTTPNELLAHCMIIAKRVGQAAQKGLGAEGFNIGINNGVTAGQVVFHTHIHVMPRVPHDGYALWHGKEYPAGEAQRVAEKLRHALASQI